MSERRLILLRHAKAEGTGVTDAARELAPRGRRDAAAVGRWLAAGGHVPDLAVVSPAVRAAQTWRIAAAELRAAEPRAAELRAAAEPPAAEPPGAGLPGAGLPGAGLPGAAETVVDDRIYANTTAALLAVVAGTPAEVGTLALVGHNPSMGMLAAALDDGTGDEAARDELAHGFPTAAVAVLSLADWTAETGTLLAYAVPRD